MLHFISWRVYWITIFICSGIYYLVIFFRYYKNTWMGKLSPYALPHVHEDTDSITSDCMDEVAAFFREIKKTKPVKEELIYSLQMIMKKYPSLKNSNDGEFLKKLIAAECAHICSVHLNEDELKHVWMD